MSDDLREQDEYELPFPQYRCPTCGKDLPLNDARVTVTCAEHRTGDRINFEVREASRSDRPAIEEICDRAIGETEIDVFGSTFDVLTGVNLIAEADGKLGGLMSLAVEGGDLVIVFLSVYPEYQGKGAGRALLEEAERYASKRCLPGIRAAVTNDDIPQLDFYQRQGFAITGISVGEAADRLGAAVPGFSGIPVRDEIYLRRSVCGC